MDVSIRRRSGRTAYASKNASIRALNCNRVRRLEAAAIFAILAVIAVTLGGCRAASSMGLPISSGNNPLLAGAAEIRESVGRQARFPTELAKAALQPHRMEAGDVLVIEPNDYNGPIRLQSDQTVQQDGTIDLGSYGSVYVAGHSTKEIQARIETAVRNVELAKRNRRNQRTALASYDGNMATTDEDLDLSVSVRMVHQESSSVYVMGEVNAPGSYPIDGNETVLDAIISAGGLSGKSNDRKIILTRPQLGGKPRVVLPVCFQHILQLGDVSTNYQLQPGDRIYVPSMNLLEDIRQSMRWRRDKSCPYCVNGSE